MNRSNAKKIAETITNDQLQEMFNNAKSQIKNWHAVSNVNKGMTKGVSWNILAKSFDVNAKHHPIAKTNMVWEFGDYLPEELKPKKQGKNMANTYVHHQDPDFNENVLK